MRMLLSVSVLILAIGCGTDDFLSRGELDPFSGVDDVFEGTGKLSKTDYDKYIAPSIQTSCNGCHKGDAVNYSWVLKKVVPQNLEESLLYTKAVGLVDHNPGVIWPADSLVAQNLAQWVKTIPFEEDKTPTENLPSEQDFNNVIFPVLENDCNMCHDNFAPDYEAALTLIKVGVPMKSRLYRTALGMDNHSKAWSPDRPEAEALAKWILLEEL